MELEEVSCSIQIFFKKRKEKKLVAIILQMDDGICHEDMQVVNNEPPWCSFPTALMKGV